ncbi:MAG: PaaI family thioesterase [Candidatus Hydrogenedentales bacterium]
MDKLELKAPQVIPEPGWIALQEFPVLGEGRPFLAGDKAENRLRVAYFLRENDQTVFARAWFGWAAQGPPGYAHGGSIASVFDEAMGMAVFSQGALALLASLSVQYRNKIALGTDTVIEAKILRQEGRKIFTSAVMSSQNGKILFAEAEGLYIKQEREQLKEMYA